MPRGASLSSVTDWSHRLLAETLHPGDLAVDLTAGNGSDTIFLAEQVGSQGLVLAFDIQPPALLRTAALLRESGFDPTLQQGRQPVEAETGVALIADGHEQLDAYLPRPPRAIIANLGYLPGGDKAMTTGAVTSLRAVEAGLASLMPGGRLVVVVYVGHPGGRDEGEQLESRLRALPPGEWETLKLQVCHRQLAPYLLVAEKK